MTERVKYHVSIVECGYREVHRFSTTTTSNQLCALLRPLLKPFGRAAKVSWVGRGIWPHSTRLVYADVLEEP